MTQRILWRRLLLSLGAVGALALGFVAAQQSSPGTHPITGREIANVMSYRGAEWLVRPERIEEEDPDQAIEALNLRPGMAVADIGAGVGYMTIRMAKKVGPSGKVYAVDIQPEMLQMLRANAEKENVAGVIEPVLSEPADPKLPKGEIDLILMVDVYHEFSQPREMLRQLHAALKPDGRMVLLEYRQEDPSIPILEDHKMSVEQVRAEVEADGFVLSEVIETLPRQHILIATKARVN